MVHLLPWPNSASFTVLKEMVPRVVPLPNKLFVGKTVSDFLRDPNLQQLVQRVINHKLKAKSESQKSAFAAYTETHLLQLES